MNFVCCQNLRINIEQINYYLFDAIASVLEIHFVSGKWPSFQVFRGGMAQELLIELDAVALPLKKDHTETTGELTIAQLDVIGKAVMSLMIAAERLSAGDKGLRDRVLVELLREGRDRYQSAPVGELVLELDRAYSCWEQIEKDEA